MNLGRPEDEVYVNWAENEPITENDSQHCVRFDRIYKTYVVDSCEIKLPFICKKNATTIEKNTYCDTYDKSMYTEIFF